MIDRLLIQMRAMQQLSSAQEVTADNLANINTPGFKGNKLFYRMLKDKVDGQSAQTIAMQQVNMDQGVLEPTGNTFDFGIEGDGFFVVDDEGNEYLTRDGRFQVDSNGFLVNSQGAQVQGAAGAIHIPEYFMASGEDGRATQVEVARDGTIRINGEVQDKIKMVEVTDTADLNRRGQAYFEVTDPETLKGSQSSTLMQGFYEKSNVEPLQQMVDMMSDMQMFEAQQRIMKTTDEMLSQVSGRLGKF